MTKHQKPWEKFTLGDLREIIAEIPTNFDKAEIYFLDEKGLKTKANSSGLLKEVGRVDYKNPEGNELFFFSQL